MDDYTKEEAVAGCIALILVIAMLGFSLGGVFLFVTEGLGLSIESWGWVLIAVLMLMTSNALKKCVQWLLKNK